MSRTPRFGLRARASVAFGLIGLLASVLLAATTYLVARSYLLDQREESAQRQTFANARLTRSALRSAGVDVAELLGTIQGESGSDVVVRFHGGWYASSVATGRDDIPGSLRELIDSGHAGRQVHRAQDGALQLAVGSPLAAVDGDYYEVFPLAELEDTLALLRNVLAVGALATTAVAATLGRFAAARVVQPLTPVSAAAHRIASGDLGTRLPEDRDPDLVELTESFNTMVSALEARVEREARFASDVSHELRSPLAALRAAVEVIERRREQLPTSVEPAFETLAGRIRSLEGLILDLLEISRYDANVVRLDAEDLEVTELLRNVLIMTGTESANLHIADGAPRTVHADRRRLAQALGAIIANADKYAGGLTDVLVQPHEGGIRILLDDAGPGVPEPERDAILQRFHRGEAGRRAGGSSGTGLGLALSVAQVELHGGSVRVDVSERGGARFVVELPQEQDG